MNVRFKCFDAVTQAGQLLETGRIFFPIGIGIQWKHARVISWLRNRARHHRSCRNMDMIRQGQMTQNHRATTHCAMRTNAGTACNPHTTCHGRVSANVNVVTNLNQVVELHAVFNDRVIKGTPIDTRIGANFNIIANANSTKLLNFFPLALVKCKAKTIGAYHHTRMQNATRTHNTPLRKRHP